MLAWAGCPVTRGSTTGVIVQLLSCTAHPYAKKQTIIATSSGASELYAIGLTTVEALQLRSLFQESKIASTVKIVIPTTSSTA